MVMFVCYFCDGASSEIHKHVADGSSGSFCGVTFLFAATLHCFRFFIILAWIMLDILVGAIGVAMLLCTEFLNNKQMIIHS